MIILEISGIPAPGLRFEVAGRNRVELRQDSALVMTGTVDDDHGGVRTHRTGAYRSPIPPLTMATARRPGKSWAHHFAAGLRATGSGPLHDGEWILGEKTLPRDLVRDFPDAYLDWWRGWHGILPLRALPAADSGRVTAYRKLVQENALPPLLALVASALDGYVLLDGHARLVAAQCEGVDPVLLVLGPRRHPDDRRAAVEAATRNFAGAGSSDAVIRAHAGTYAAIERSLGRTRAWPAAKG